MQKNLGVGSFPGGLGEAVDGISDLPVINTDGDIHAAVCRTDSSLLLKTCIVWRGTPGGVPDPLRLLYFASVTVRFSVVECDSDPEVAFMVSV